MPANRAGNAVVIKPSPLTPLSTIRLVEIVNEATPPGVVSILIGDNKIGSKMTAHPGVGKVTFTGSIATGRKVMESGAATLKRLMLELGGNDAGIVLPDADPKAIAEGLFGGAFINGGQSCAAMKRLYVRDSIHDDMCDALASFAKAILMDDGLDEASILGPVQNRRQYEIVANFVAEARDKGGRVLLGGNPGNGPGNFYPIALVADIDRGCRLVDEEQFRAMGLESSTVFGMRFRPC